MRHLEHWDQIVLYAGAIRHTLGQEWLRVLAPFLVASMAGAAVSLIVVREQVSGLKMQVDGLTNKIDTGILPLANERIKRIQLEMLQIHHEHELTLDAIAALQKESPLKCVECHMRQLTPTHPKLKKSE